MLEDGKREGSVLASVDSVVYAHVIMASLTGILVQWFVDGESIDVPVFVRTFRNILLKGMTGKEG